MGKRDQRVDEYIANSAEFAQPILRELRELVHQGCPEVEETLKWSFPHFTYKGILCGMASFKAHCAFYFRKGSLIEGLRQNRSDEAMGQFGRVTSRKDLPPKSTLLAYIKEARRLNEEGVKPATKKRSGNRKELVVPEYFMAALKKDKKALASFEAFPYSHKKEYVEWVTEAKTEATRDKRVHTSLEWLAQGKSRNWKYERR